MKKEKSHITTSSKQLKTSLTGQITSLKNELKVAKQETEAAEKRVKVLKETQEKQAKTIETQSKKISNLQKKIEEQNDPEVNKERINELEAAIKTQEALYNSVLSKLSTAGKELEAEKVKLQKELEKIQ